MCESFLPFHRMVQTFNIPSNKTKVICHTHIINKVMKQYSHILNIKNTKQVTLVDLRQEIKKGKITVIDSGTWVVGPISIAPSASPLLRLLSYLLLLQKGCNCHWMGAV